MKSLKLTLLILVLIFLSANERYIKYFINELAFITGNNIPKTEILRKSHIRAEYDNLDRLLIKSLISAKGEVLKQEEYSYIDQNKSIRQKDLVDKQGHVYYKTIFGRESESLSYIEWVFGIDSVKKWNDRFTTSELNKLDKPENYRFFDVDFVHPFVAKKGILFFILKSRPATINSDLNIVSKSVKKFADSIPAVPIIILEMPISYNC